MKKYTPNPFSTDHIELPNSLIQLTELLAKNTHDTWAEKRMKEGWECGVERDDKNKLHPDLIPYEQLSDEEKEYDRITAMQTLKAILALGYKIIEPEK